MAVAVAAVVVVVVEVVVVVVVVVVPPIRTSFVYGTLTKHLQTNNLLEITHEKVSLIVSRV